MSLDVCLRGQPREVSRCCECGNVHKKTESECLYDADITHNLNAMAREAGIYFHLWRPEEIGITKASQLIEPLRAGLALLKSDKSRFEKFNTPNGWGLYEHFVPFVEKYLNACIANPDANVEARR
jgi:hypothetical protein